LRKLERERERERLTWDECRKENLVELGLYGEWALDRVEWRDLEMALR